MASVESRLQDIRERFEADKQVWDPIRAEGDRDMRAVAGDVWDPKDRAAREKAGRPCLSFDELSQYTNSLINEVRANKRAIKVTAIGFGANEQTASFRQNLIRQIEYRSNAQQAYTVMFENAVQRGYGFLQVVPRYVNPEESDDQELAIEPLYNPSLVTPDAHALRSDLSDMRHCTIHEIRRWEEFRRRFPDAEQRTFSHALALEAPGWLTETSVQVASHWSMEETRRTRLSWQTQGQAVRVWEDEYRGAKPKDNFRSTPVAINRVKNVVTNGLEILEETDWPGKWIPVVGCFGKVLFLTENGQTTRKLLSLVRLALDPAMLYAYYRTTEAEIVGMVPKFPYFVRRGSLAPDQMALLQQSNHTPVAAIEVEGHLDEMPGGAPPEFPMRQPWDPPIQAFEFGSESTRRAIQAAIGSVPLPTDAQRLNQKSGKALQKIESSRQQGQFHFIDHYEDAITRTGAILEDLIPHYYDTARDVTTRKPDDATEVVRINDPAAEGGYLPTNQGLHDVTISTGPSYDSEREAASDFADTLMTMGPPMTPLVADLACKLKNLGPVGDQIAERFKALLPPEVRQAESQKSNDPMAAQREAMALKQQVGQMQQMLGEAQKAVEADTIKVQGQLQAKQVEIAANQQMKQWELRAQHDLQVELQAMKNAASIRVAEINAMVQTQAGLTSARTEEIALAAKMDDAERARQADAEAAETGRQFDATMAERAHEQALEAGAVAHEQGQAAADAEQRRGLETGAVEHRRALEQGRQGIAGQIAVVKSKPQPKPAPKPTGGQ